MGMLAITRAAWSSILNIELCSPMHWGSESGTKVDFVLKYKFLLQGMVWNIPARHSVWPMGIFRSCPVQNHLEYDPKMFMDILDRTKFKDLWA